MRGCAVLSQTPSADQIKDQIVVVLISDHWRRFEMIIPPGLTVTIRFQLLTRFLTFQCGVSARILCQKKNCGLL